MTGGGAQRSERPQAGALDPDEFLFERYRTPRGRRRMLNAYYLVKPLIPRAAHLAARRVRAKSIRPSFPSWPIEPLLVEHQHALWRRSLAERSLTRLPLVGFWPDHLNFAVTMTHDVEGELGVENIPAVLELERRHGIVSSWNFVAEWYPIPDGTFERVREAGCEVGLHGVRHDGLLFRDRETFDSRLPRIHRYMREWGAVGFRSPATHRNVAWMADLACLYDSSFPDTDPYEPEPGGCCSIFPFFIGDLVELPITMVQDHTLWEILRRPNLDLWREKGDWVIANHGLINIIVHPDYVRSPERLALYDQLLGYLRERIGSRRGWHALPREVASWWKARSRMSVSQEAGAPILAADEPSAEWSPRAAIAWAQERDGMMHVDA
jgi:peptidoglycan/xylan/chitin deacetylase (PgdA/CDA1 family)